MYYRGAAAALVVFDCTSTESYQRSQSWLRELQRSANPGIVICLVANKIDLVANQQVDLAQAEGFAADQGILFAKCSAKTGEGVTEIFTAIAKKLPLGQSKAGGATVDLSKRPPASVSAQQGGCC